MANESTAGTPTNSTPEKNDPVVFLSSQDIAQIAYELDIELPQIPKVKRKGDQISNTVSATASDAPSAKKSKPSHE